MTQNQRVNYIKRTRGAVGRFLDIMTELRALDKEYQSVSMGTILDDADFADWDITKTEFIAAIVSIEAIETLLGQGHYANLFGVRMY